MQSQESATNRSVPDPIAKYSKNSRFYPSACQWQKLGNDWDYFNQEESKISQNLLTHIKRIIGLVIYTTNCMITVIKDTTVWQNHRPFQPILRSCHVRT